MADSLHDEALGRLEWDAGAGQYFGRLEFRPGEPVGVTLALREASPGRVRRVLAFAHRQLVLMRRGEAGARGYRRRAARELLRRRPGPKGAAVEARLAAALRLERLAFDDDGLSALYYGSARSPETQAAVAIDARGRVTLVDPRPRSEVAAARRALGRPAAVPEPFVDRTFGRLTWEPEGDRFVGRFAFAPGRDVAVEFLLSGNVEGDVHELLPLARARLSVLRRGEPRYRRRAAAALRAAEVRLTRLTFDEDGGTALTFVADAPPGGQAVVMTDERGRVVGVEVG